jgi:hypothetical protein
MAARKKTAKQPPHSMSDIHASFKSNLQSLESFVAGLGPVAKQHDLAMIGKVEEAASTMVERVVKEFGLPAGDLKKLEEALGNLNPGQKKRMKEITVECMQGIVKLSPPQERLLYQASFVLLMSYVDFLISDLVHYYYNKYPGSLSEKEHILTLGELGNFSEISDAMEYLIDKAVQRVLFDTFDNQVLYLKSTLKVEIEGKYPSWSRLQEAMERRHLIVHNNCIVNGRYLSKVDLTIVPEKRGQLKEGAELQIREAYFDDILEEALVAGITLIQCCWRKWERASINDADGSLNAVIYDLLLKEKWTVAERIGSIAKQFGGASQQARMHFHVNYCQALKWQGKNADLETELKSLDVSALSPKYCLAVAALKSDQKAFWANVENAIAVDEMKEEDSMEWPLFRELRNDPAYATRIKEVFASVAAKEPKADQ